jgi:hypothetical protein
MGTRFHNALIRGYQSAVETIVGVILFCAEYAPSVLVWLALLAPLAWLVRRRWARAASALA